MHIIAPITSNGSGFPNISAIISYDRPLIVDESRVVPVRDNNTIIKPCDVMVPLDYNRYFISLRDPLGRAITLC